MSFHPLMVYDSEHFHKSERGRLDEGGPFVFTPERRANLDDILTKYPPEQKRSAVLAALYLVQEQQGYLTAGGMRTLSCALNGAERVTEALSEKLGIKLGETDPSGMFTLLEFECLGACDRAPIVMVNNEHWHEKATPESCSKLVDDIKARGIDVFSGCHLRVEK